MMKFFLLALATVAVPVGANQSVQVHAPGMVIQADESTIDLRNGQKVFLGDVELNHQAFVLTSDKLVENKQDKTREITATGSPARFAQKSPFSERVSHGHAKKIVYYETRGELHLWDYTVTDLGGNVLRGRKAVYYLPGSKGS